MRRLNVNKIWKNILYFTFLWIMLCSVFGQSYIRASADFISENGQVLPCNNTETEMEEIIIEQLNKLDLAELQAYIHSLQDFKDDSIIERLISYIKGEGIDYKSFGAELLQIILSKIEELLPSFLCIITITLLMGLLSSIRSISAGGAISEIIFFVGYSAILIPLLSVLTECIGKTFACVNALQEQIQLIFPLMLTLLAVTGGTVTVAIVRPAVAFFASSIITIITSVILPLTIIIIAFSITGNLSKELKINKFTLFFKGINKWIIGISISIFSLFITIQGISAASYDGVMRRAAKYAIGNGVPIIGGFLSGGFDLAIAGSVLIKNSLGNLGIFLMISVVLEPLLLLIALNLLLRFVSAIAQPIGDNRISDFLGETAANLNFCTASILLVAFLYFLSIMILVCSTEVFF